MTETLSELLESFAISVQVEKMSEGKRLSGKDLEWKRISSKQNARWQHLSRGLYYKRVTIVIDAPGVIKVTLQIVASLMIVTHL
jgi:hypothetical protein